jgi:hypothetical protein
MIRIAIRREIADLILEALDIAVSRKLTPHHTQAFVLDVIRAERPDISQGDLHILVHRVWQRLAGPGPEPTPGA